MKNIWGPRSRGYLVGLLLGVLAPTGVLAQAGSSAEPGQILNLVRATELRSDKLGSAAVLAKLAAGSKLRLLGVEGGWALVENAASSDRQAPGLQGWVRASAVNLQAGNSGVSALDSGRLAGGNSALTLGVRSLPPRVNRHALIIGISRYADPATTDLPGARIDKQSATQMAHAMQVPQSNIKYLQDEQATGNNIRQALRDLSDEVQDGDRVFIHFSGHGTRYNDPASGGCVEALLAYDGGLNGLITNRELVDMLKVITNKTDKLFVMYDACHSGGVAQAASSVRTRGLANANDEGALRPKFAGTSEECGRAVNVKTRNLVVEAVTKGALPQDIIHVSASRDNEISFDDELKGGLATQFMRDCMLRDAKDLDDSGAISMDEIRICAQEKINKRMANDVNYKPHTLVLNGNAAFVPAWFSQASVASISSVTAPLALLPVAAPVVAPPPAPLTGEQSLRQMFEQRDAKRKVQVSAAKDKLKVGQDALELTIQSDRAGFVYVALAGSDNKSVYLLFPNDLDQDNKIEAGKPLLLPRPTWRAKAGGPFGTNNLLVLVADGPRDTAALAANKAGPFVSSLNDAQGRAKLGALMTNSKLAASSACTAPGARQRNVQCSDAYGAAMLAVEEVK